MGRTAILLLTLAALVGSGCTQGVPPYFTAGYPTTSNPTTTSLDIEVAINTVGSVYYVVVTDGSPAPTSAQVVAGLATYTAGSTTVTVLDSGALTAAVVDTMVSTTVSGLTAQTAYDFYFVANDGVGNVQPVPTLITDLTSDVVGPSFLSPFPIADNVWTGSLDLLLQTDQASTLYYAIYLASDPAPSSAVLKAQTDPGLVSAVACSGPTGIVIGAAPYFAPAGTFFTRAPVRSNTTDACANVYDPSIAPLCSTCPDLVSGTQYTAYFISVDAVGNWGPVSTLTFSSADVSPPTFANWMPTGTLNTPMPTGFTLTVQSADKNGTAFYMVVRAGSAPPTAALVKGGVNYIRGAPGSAQWVYVQAAGSWPFSTALPTSIVVSGLMNGTAYDTYLVAQDSGNQNTTSVRYLSGTPVLQTSPILVGSNQATLTGLPPQLIGAGLPKAINVTDTNITLVFRVSENNTAVFYAVVPRWDFRVPVPKPNASAIFFGVVPNATVCETTGVAVTWANQTMTSSVQSDMTCGYPAQPVLVLPNQAYDVFIVAADVNGTFGDVKRFSVRTVDSIAPVCTLSTPIVVYNAQAPYPLGRTGIVKVNFTLALSKIGTAYWMISPATVRAPTSAEVVAGAPVSYPQVFLYGSVDVRTPNVLVEVSAQGLPAATPVNIWVVGMDDAANAKNQPYLAVPPANNIQVTPAIATLITADVTPPVFTTGYPMMLYDGTRLQANQVDLSVMMDEEGTVYWVVVPAEFQYNKLLTDGSARRRPTPAELMDFTGPGGSQDAAVSGQVTGGFVYVPSGNVPSNLTITGLDAGTKYWLWLVAEDIKQGIPSNNTFNVQSKATLLTFTTRVDTPPAYAAGYPTAISGGNSIAITIGLNNTLATANKWTTAGYAYYIVLDQGSAAPTSADVLNTLEGATTSTGAVVRKRCGGNQSFPISAPLQETVCTVTGLLANTYDVYVVVTDVADNDIAKGAPWPGVNVQATPTLITGVQTTLPSAPVFDMDTVANASTPRVIALTGTTMTFGVALVLPGAATGQVFWQVVARPVATPPTADMVQFPRTATAARGVVAIPGSGTIVNDTATDLVTGTDYTLFAVAADSANFPATMVNSAVSAVNFSTAAVVPPVFVGKFTSRGTVENVTGGGFFVVVQLDRPGSYYFVVVEYGSPQPSVADVISGSGVGGSDAFACGYTQVPAGSTNATAVILNTTQVDGCATLGGIDCCTSPTIMSETSYDVWIVAQDNGQGGDPASAVVGAVNTSNVQTITTRALRTGAPPTSASVVTARVTAPVFTGGSPIVSNLRGSAFDLSVATSTPSTVFYVVVASANATVTPTQAQILAGTDANGYPTQAAGNISVKVGSLATSLSPTLYTRMIAGLPRLTNYGDIFRVFLFTQDFEPTGMSALVSPAVPNKSPVSFIDGSTVDIYAPAFLPSFPRAVTLDLATGYGPTYISTLNITASLDENATCFYVAFPHALPGSGDPGSYPPTSAQVIAGLDYSGNTAFVQGNWSVPSGTQSSVITTNWLEDAVVYDVYVTCQDLPRTYLVNVATSGIHTQPLPAKVTVVTVTGNAPLWTGNPFQQDTSDLRTWAWYYGHSKYPYFSQASATGFILTVRMTQNGTVAYTVVPRLDADPVKADVIATSVNGALNYTSKAAVSPPNTLVTPLAAGNISVAANTTANITVTGLSGADYVVYVITVDGATGNLGDGDILQGFVENPTKMAPGVFSFDPVIADEDIVLNVLTTSKANVSYVVLNAGAPAPNPWQIVNGLDSLNNSAPCFNDPKPQLPTPPPGSPGNRGIPRITCYIANTYNTYASGSFVCPAGSTSTPCTIGTVTNLTAGRSYDIYVVSMLPSEAEITGSDYSTFGSSYNEFSRVPVVYTVTTTDTEAPDFLPGYPAVININSSSFTLTAQMEEAGTLYYVLVPQIGGVPPTRPTSAQVFAALDGDGNAPLAAGTILMPAIANPEGFNGVTAYSVTFTGLNAATVYDTYLAAEDMAGNQQALVTRVVTLIEDDNALLGSLSVSAGVILPVFSPSVPLYNAYLNDTYTTVIITAAPLSAAATLTINGVSVVHSTPTLYNISFGRNTFVIVVTAEDSVNNLTYTLNVNRVPSFNDYNATLQVLSLIWATPAGSYTVNSTDMGGAQWPDCLTGCLLYPDSPADCDAVNPSCIMDSNQTIYYASIPSSVSEVDVYALATSPLATITLFYETAEAADDGTEVAMLVGGQAYTESTLVDLFKLQQYGGNEIKIGVVAPDGTSQLYVIRITRYGPGIYEGWEPVIPSTALLGPRYGLEYNGDDPLTVRVLMDPTVVPLNVIPYLDVMPPLFISSYPMVTAGSTSANFKVMLNEPGVCYFIVLSANVAYPSPDPPDVKNNRPPSGTTLVAQGQLPYRGDPVAGYSLTRETSITITGLAPLSNYTVWFAVEDKAKDLRMEPKPNMQLAATPVQFFTTS